MSQYTYTLNPGKEQTDKKHAYKRSQLEQMTTFQLREICRKERLVTTSVAPLDREGFIRLIMRFRGQKDYRHIDEFCEGGMERIQGVLDRLPLHTVQDGGIRMPASLVLYNNMAMDELDGGLTQSAGVPLYEGNLLLVDEAFRVHTCLFLKQAGNDYFISKGKDVPIVAPEKHQYSILYFPAEHISEYLYEQYWGMESLFPGTVSCIRIPLLDMVVKDAEETQLPLVIDFGSCNTTMGICLQDGSRKIAVSGNGHVIPSVVGIAGMHNEMPQYVFGHEATMVSQGNYQDQDVPVFYDIKRWISDPARDESVILTNGVKVLVNRKDMLQAFFQYLLEEARKQFKFQFRYVQLLAPIRQKEKFRELFQEILPEVEIDCSLDEGMAVLFSSIDKLVAGGNYEPDHWYHALIVDCGGGTTDLTSGQFRIHSGRVSYNIDLRTSFENGDTNFGGNNLTYRILQLLKVKICQTISPNDIWEGQNLESAYRKAEQILPTAFRDYAEKGRDEYFYVKNNYYYLFDLAERIKESFFQQGFQYELWISTVEAAKDVEGDRLFLDKWKLSIIKNGKMMRLEKNISFQLYLHQIEILLRPDIYQIMKRFLEPKFYNNELQNYEMIKLTGQSCKSRLFEEALKEYVPGIRIQKSGQEQKGTELKMCCLEGALSYFFNCKLGYMKVSQSYHVGALPYEIMAYTHEGKEKTLVHSLDREDHIGYISRFMVGKQLDIHLLDSSGERLKTYYYECGMNQFERTTQEAINEAYAGTVIQEETDIIQEGEMKFFVWVSRKRWGFNVLPVLREQELLYKGKETFFDFEDDTWEENFFDGIK